ncbi:uncharacterized protein K02A2.6-like [Xenia sp. Carnegie-2017]|uniref:uncharacterized protein K02A2.6-like n=1 Tax=Xenia sp. Carnegie-2017 TaxID=2897299 RepID=UPI001F035BE4|nr:uncharacterized protein K02A2.6-like [Xenia sp. Carnegie-2017]
MDNLRGIPFPSMDWTARNLPETFRKFKRNCEIVFAGPLNDQTEAVKVNYLKLFLGDEGQDIIDGLDLTADEEKELDSYWSKLQQYVRPKTNFRVVRAQLRESKQAPDETIDNFMTRARILADDCEYKDKEEQLIDTLIFGVNSNEVCKKLLTKDSSLKLHDAMKIARAEEASQKHVTALQETKTISAVKSTPRNQNRQYHQRSQTTQSQKSPYRPNVRQNGCLNCGRAHNRDDICPARNDNCNFCGKRGHWERVCITKQYRQMDRSQQNPRRESSAKTHVNSLEYAGTSCDDYNATIDFTFDSLEYCALKGEELFSTVRIHGERGPYNLRCKVDTGAPTSVISKKIYRELFPNDFDNSGKLKPETKIMPAQVKVKTYGGSELQHIGYFTTTIRHGRETAQVQFLVTETDDTPLLGLPSLRQLRLIKESCNTDCTLCNSQTGICHIKTQQKPIQISKDSLLKHYPECFKEIGTLPGKYKIPIRDDAIPCKDAPRSVPESQREPLRKELRRIQDIGVIEKVDGPTDWVSSIVVVPKPNGDVRICLDPKRLNDAIKREHHYIQKLEDVLPQLSNAKVFSKLDARSGYWNVVLDEESKLLTTFNTPMGRYCFKRLPFGLVSAQDIFQRKIDKTYDGLPGIICIADDIVVYGKDDKTHDENLLRVMERTKERNLSLNYDKCHIKQSSIGFYGHILTSEGIKPDPSKVSAIKDMKQPQNVSQLLSFLSSAKYLAPFTPDLSDLCAPLNKLTRKDVDFQWGPEHQEAFERIKDNIANVGVLAYFDPTRPVTIQCDASTEGLGAILYQDNKPVTVASKTLTNTEQNYTNIEREMLAIVFALTRFHHYTYGRHVLVESDHKPLESITKKPVSTASPRIKRMLLKIQPYDYTVKYVPGKQLPVPDMLSRSPIPGPEIPQLDVSIGSLAHMTTSRLEKIKIATHLDPLLQKLTHQVMVGWPEHRQNCPIDLHQFWNFRDEIAVHDGILMKGDRVIIPKTCQAEILHRIHTGHQGIEKCRLRARQAVYWYGIDKDIKDMVKRCASCQQHQTSNPKETIIQQEALKPWEVVSSDLYHWNNANYLLLVDYYSSYFVVRKLSSTRSSDIISKLKAIFAEFGIPRKLVSDNGPQYTSQDFEKFTKEYGFEHSTSSPHYHQANGKVERFVATVKNTLQKCKETHQDPALALLAVRNTPISSTVPSPAELMFQRKLDDGLSFKSSFHQTAQQDISQHRQRHVQRYDKRARDRPDLAIGQSVRIQNPTTKLWDPAIVTQKLVEPRSYEVKASNGATYRRNRRHINTTDEDFTNTDTEDLTTYSETEPLPDDPARTTSSPCRAVPQDNIVITRSGRISKPPQRLINM